MLYAKKAQTIKNIPTKTYKSGFKCQFCEHEYKLYSSFTRHLLSCEQMDRYNSDSPDIILGYLLWCESFKNTNRKTLDLLTFTKHRDYKFFVNLAEFCNKMLLPKEAAISYMNWCISEHKKLNQWCSEDLYYKFIANSAIGITFETAIQISLEYMNKNQLTYNILMKEMPVSRLLNLFDLGRISYWFLFINESKTKILLNRCNEHQRNKLLKIIKLNIYLVMKPRYSNLF